MTVQGVSQNEYVPLPDCFVPRKDQLRFVLFWLLSEYVLMVVGQRPTTGVLAASKRIHPDAVITPDIRQLTQGPVEYRPLLK